MDIIVSNGDRTEVKVTSIDVSDLTGRTHSSVKRTVKTLSDKGLITFEQIVQKSNGRPSTVFEFSERDALVVVGSISHEHISKLVDYIDAQKRQLQKRLPAWFDKISPEANILLNDMSNRIEQLSEVVQDQGHQLEIAKPKVEFADKVADSGGYHTFRQVAKTLKANEHQFKEYLLENRIMYRLNGQLMAQQHHIDARRFRVFSGVASNGHAYTYAKFTSKGLVWIGEKWMKHLDSCTKQQTLVTQGTFHD